MRFSDLNERLLASVWRSAVFRKILRGGAWMAGSTIIAQIAGLVNSILIARVLGVEEFGKFGILSGTVLAFAALATRSMQVTATKFLSQYRTVDPERAGRLCGLCWASSGLIGSVVASAIFIFAEPLAAWIGEPLLQGLLQIGAISMVLSSIVGVQSGMILAFQRIKFLALTAAAFALCRPLVLPALAREFGLIGVVWGLVVLVGANWIANSILLRRCFRESQVRFRFRGILQERAILWKFTLPHAMGALVNTPVTWLALMLLARQPEGVFAVAIFTAVEKWRKVILFLPGTLSKPSLPILAESFGLGNYRRAGRVILGTVWLNATACGCIALLLALGAPFLLGLYGPEYRAHGVSTMWVFLAAAFLQSLIVPLGDSIATAGRTWFGLIGTLLKSGLLLAVAAALVPLGAIGLAWAYLASSAALLAFQILLAAWIVLGRRAI